MKLEERLLRKGLISKEVLAKAEVLATETHAPLATVLVDRGMVNETEMLRTQAELYGLGFVKLEETAIDRAAVDNVPAKLAAHYHMMPVRLKGEMLTLAVSNPLERSAVEDVETNLGYHVERVLACREDIEKALKRYYGVGAETVERILSESSDREAAESAESHDLEKMAEDASVVRLVNQLLQEAIGDRATDVHFQAGRNGVSVRRRIDGVLYDTQVPESIRLLYAAIVSRVKLMSGLNIVERRLPQDGRTRVTIGKKQYDLRVSIVPAMHGEDVVVRILPSTMLFDMGDLGFSDAHLGILKGLIAQPHGILFVTGPTGSGKTTTLYACLSRLNSHTRKIITIEDPVEYELENVVQTQIQPQIGLTFARALRSMLRHDPDVMMIGEVRDRETAEIAVQTAMTGHLVLSTLHTNDAASGAVRLMDMGIDPYLITSTVLGFIAQRLVRTICSGCKERFESDGGAAFRGKGCKLCNGSGFRGRIAISEFIPLVPEIQRLILEKVSAQGIRAKADEMGLTTLAMDGEDKVMRGVTTKEEVLRVTRM